MELWRPFKPEDMSDEEFNEIVEKMANLPLEHILSAKEIRAALENAERNKEKK